MDTQEQIKKYLNSLPEVKRAEMEELQRIIIQLSPKSKVWFFDGKNDEGKVVSNPNIGFGSHTMKYANGKTADWFQIGISANTTGISVYILGIADKTYLAKTFGKNIGKANVTGYCIKFKTLKGINIDVLQDALRFGFENK